MFVRTFNDEKIDLNEIHIERRVQINSILLKIKKKSNIKITISEILKKFVEIIEKNKIYELSNHEFDDHSINLKSNKKFLYDLIYFLFENELSILKIYFDCKKIYD